MLSLFHCCVYFFRYTCWLRYLCRFIFVFTTILCSNLCNLLSKLQTTLREGSTVFWITFFEEVLRVLIPSFLCREKFVHNYCSGFSSDFYTGFFPCFLQKIRICSNSIVKVKLSCQTKVKFIFSSISRGLESWSVNHTSMYGNIEQNVSL